MQENSKVIKKARIFARLANLFKRLHVSLSLTERFAIAGLFATIVMATVTSLFVTQYLHKVQLDEVARRASDVVSHLVSSEITEAQFEINRDNVSTWGIWLGKLEDVSHINGVRVWNTDGTVIYSSELMHIGQRLKLKEIDEAIRTGEPVGAFEPNSLTWSQQVSTEVYEVFVPVKARGQNKVIGVYELYEDYAPIAAQMSQTTAIVWSLAFLIFGFLFFALLATLAASMRKQMAYHDPLTGLANRHLFQEKADKVLALSRRSDAAAILYMDLSRFKTVNDSLGQAAGDDILKQIATRLKESIRVEDTAARLGGDEFALLLTNIETGERAIHIAKRLQEMFTLPFRTHGQTIHLEVNIGLALLAKESVTSVGAWLTQANTAMLRSKTNYTKFQIYNPEMQSYTLERLQLESSLRDALKNHEFILHYQPILNRKQELIGAEALVRWIHPEKGMISPGLFIPLAEETGLIRSLDQWVMHTAITQAKEWEDQGRNLKVSVNLSPQTFQDSDFVNWLESQLIETELTPNLLTVEITEYVFAQAESSRKSLEALKHLGVGIALDDFGKGYSSLAYLENLPIDRIKMDRQFIQGIGKRPTSEAIIKTIIALTDNLGIESLAEGIEDEEQLQWLEREGCKFYQGFLFSQPLPVDRLFSASIAYALESTEASSEIHLN